MGAGAIGAEATGAASARDDSPRRKRGYGWYVVQVQTGRELALCRAIEYVCDPANVAPDPADLDPSLDPEDPEAPEPRPLLKECFAPEFSTRRKYRGEWRDLQKPLLPGYVIVVTADPNPLSRRLRRIPKYARLLTMGETFVPLRPSERAWIEEFTREGERVVPISIAYRRGDTLVVTQGPLKGREGMVTRVIRKKCLAVVELTVGGKRVTTTVGLAVVPEQEA